MYFATWVYTPVFNTWFARPAIYCLRAGNAPSQALQLLEIPHYSVYAYAWVHTNIYGTFSSVSLIENSNKEAIREAAIMSPWVWAPWAHEAMGPMGPMGPNGAPWAPRGSRGPWGPMGVLGKGNKRETPIYIYIYIYNAYIYIYVSVRNRCVCFHFKNGGDYLGHPIELQSRPPAALRLFAIRWPAGRPTGGRLGPDGAHGAARKFDAKTLHMNSNTSPDTLV